MRIRTVKPEFWSHPVMGRMEDRTRLLALALLNHADDHGYFMADPAIVRGACAPFREDLATIRDDLARLIEVGWIDMGRHPEHGAIGWVCKWTEHQKVDRPRESKISDKCSTDRFVRNSSKPREIIAKPPVIVALEGNREQGREQGKEQGKEQGGDSPRSPALGGGEQDSGQPDSRMAAQKGREVLTGLLIAAGCTLKMGRQDIMHEWVTIARGYSPEWIQRMLAIIPTPTRPSDLKARLKKHQGEWEARGKASG